MATVRLHDSAPDAHLQPESCVMFERSVTLPATPSEVWRALTESDELSRWFGCPVELDARPGGRVTVHEAERVRRGLVEEVEPAHRLTVRWLPDVGSIERRTRVAFVLEAIPEGTRLTVTEAPLWGRPLESLVGAS
jgi:uncharacterized protein YndB with AHSA1/START domain